MLRVQAMVTQTMADDNARPSISEMFPDAYDPDKSFWVHSEINNNLKECFVEIDECLAHGDFKQAKKPIKMIAEQLPVSARDSYLRRLVYNYCYLRPSEVRIQKFEIPVELTNEYERIYSGNNVEIGNVEPPDALAALIRRSRADTIKVYGVDFIKSNVSVRYANYLLPSPYKCDDTQDVNSQLLSVMHYDEKKGITSIVYLTDVKETNGCFSYLAGSHLLNQSLSIRSFHETLTEDLHLKTADDAHRAGIPSNLFGTLAYGENLPLKKREIAKRYVTKLVGPAGTSISFTGNTLIHGGGWPLEGHRIAMFISHVGRFGHRAKYLIPYVWHFRLAA